MKLAVSLKPRLNNFFHPFLGAHLHEAVCTYAQMMLIQIAVLCDHFVKHLYLSSCYLLV